MTKDILLVYDSEDTVEWMEYIRDFLTSSETLKISVLEKDLAKDEKEIVSLCSQYKVVTLVLSPSMLETMAKVAGHLRPVLAGHTSVSVIKLYIEEKDFISQVKNTYGCENWKLLEMQAEDDQNKKMMSEIIDFLQKTTEKLQKKPSTPSRERSILKEVCPDCIKQKGEKVLVIFRTEIDSDKLVQVMVGESGHIETTRLNPYCYSFKAPPNKEGKFTLHIYFDGVKATKRAIKYLSLESQAYTCPVFMCQLLGLPTDDGYKSLDDRLTHLYQSSLPSDAALAHIFTPKNMLSQASGTNSEDELPTLLHFACYYGLQELCTCIMDTPGASHVFNICNCRDMNPLDLAKEQQHTDLVDYIETFMEMHDYIGAFEDIYEKMSGGKLISIPGYINMNRTGDVEGYTSMKGGYMPMGGNGTGMAEDDYNYVGARLPHVEDGYVIKTPVEEDDYVIKTKSTCDKVEEVDSDEDITQPAVPKRLPSKTKPTLPQKPAPSVDIAPPRPPKTPTSPPGDHQTYPGDHQTLEDDRQSQAIGVVDYRTSDIFSKPDPLSPGSMGSLHMNELIDIQESYKRGEFTLTDIEMLFHSWQDRKKEGLAPSIKERHEYKVKQLHNMKENYATLLRQAEPTKKKGFFGRMLSKKKEPAIPIQIEHNVQPNKYEAFPFTLRGDVDRESRLSVGSNRSSTASTCSTASTRSSSSQDSFSQDSAIHDLEPIDEDIPEDAAPPTPRRPSKHKHQENRTSWGKEFLQSVSNKPNSRLPTPPPITGKPHRPVPRHDTVPVVPPRPGPVDTRKRSK